MRKAAVRRKTKETDITLRLSLDGRGKHSVDTSIAFLDHMLSLMSKHGLMDLFVKARGDIDVDYHHTVEDVGLALGEALREALGGMKGIRRFGEASAPMDEALARVSIDISGRPYLIYRVEMPKRSKIKNFEADLVEDFLRALASKAAITLHVEVPYGRNAHHIVEAVFKALGRALGEAVSLDPKVKGVPSTKGKI